MKRYVRLARQILSSNLGELPRPYRFTYIVTYRCQMRCSMCDIWRKPPAPELTVQEIEHFFRTNPFFSWINLSGGELFLRPDFPDILSIINRLCSNLLLLNFPTNGYLTENIVSTIESLLRRRAFPRFLVTISLDGPPAIHNRIRGRAEAWERATETFSALRRLEEPGFQVFFGMTLQRDNLGSFQETLDSLRGKIPGITANDIHVNLAQSSEHYYSNSTTLLPTSVSDIVSHLESYWKQRARPWLNPVFWLEQAYQKQIPAFLRSGRSPMRCQALSASFFLDPAGVVYPCSMFNRPLGSLRDHGFSLPDLWSTALRKDVRQQIRQGNCPHCWTPCEAYQTILADLPRAAVSCLCRQPLSEQVFAQPAVSKDT